MACSPGSKQPTVMAQKKLEKFIAVIIIFFVVIIYAGYASKLGPAEPIHDGALFKPAVDYADGRAFYKETSTYYGTLTAIADGTLIKIFGAQLLTLRLSRAVAYALIAVMLFLIWSLYLPIVLNLFSVALTILLAPYYLDWFMPWNNIYGILLLLIAGYMLLLYFLENRILYIFVFGLLTAAICWIRINLGWGASLSFLFVLFLLLYVDRVKFKKVVLYALCGFVMTHFVMFSFLALEGVTADWYRYIFGDFMNTGLLPNLLGSYRTGSTSFSLLYFLSCMLPGLFEPVRWLVTKPWSLFPIITFITIAVLILSIFREKLIDKEFPLTLLIIYSASSWVQTYPLADLHHVYWAAIPLMPVVTYSLYSLGHLSSRKFIVGGNRVKLYLQALVIGILVLCWWGDIGLRNSFFIHKLSFPGRPNQPSLGDWTSLSEPRVLKGMLMSPGAAAFNKSFYSDLLTSNCGSNLFSFTPLIPAPLLMTYIDQNNNFGPDWVFQDLPVLDSKKKSESIFSLSPDSDIVTNKQSRLFKYIEENSPLLLIDSESDWLGKLPGYTIISSYEIPIGANYVKYLYASKSVSLIGRCAASSSRTQIDELPRANR